MLRFIAILFIIVIAFRIISRFILPIFHITSVTNDRLRQMQEQMKEMDRKVNEQNTKKTARVEKEGDYIDYEELPQTPKGASQENKYRR